MRAWCGVSITFAISKYWRSQIKHVFQVSNVLLKHGLSLVKSLVSVIETNIVGLLSSFSGCSSALGYSVSGDTIDIASPGELILVLLPQSKWNWAVIDIHSIRGLLRHLSRGRGTRSRGKRVCSCMSSANVLISSTHLSKTSNKNLIGGQFSVFIYGLLEK